MSIRSKLVNAALGKNRLSLIIATNSTSGKSEEDERRQKSLWVSKPAKCENKQEISDITCNVLT